MKPAVITTHLKDWNGTDLLGAEFAWCRLLSKLASFKGKKISASVCRDPSFLRSQMNSGNFMWWCYCLPYSCVVSSLKIYLSQNFTPLHSSNCSYFHWQNSNFVDLGKEMEKEAQLLFLAVSQNHWYFTQIFLNLR